MRGHVEIVNFLLQSGADKNKRNKQDFLPVRLTAACAFLPGLSARRLAGGHVQAGVEQFLALRAGGADRRVNAADRLNNV